MKRFHLFAILLLLSSIPSSFAQPLAIFSRGDARATGTAIQPSDASAAAFFAAYARDRSADTFYEAELPFMNPPEWGKVITERTGGAVRYHRSFAGGFVCRIQLHDLAPSHAYILTLNGNPQRAGNDLLLSPVRGNEKEKYYDFLDIKTDAQGRYDAELGIQLKPGDYEVRLYVKDTADFKIVLYRDFFKFAVTD